MRLDDEMRRLWWRVWTRWMRFLMWLVPRLKRLSLRLAQRRADLLENANRRRQAIIRRKRK
jgi:hypothetical protein